jgi:hypothetical protein
VRKTPLKKRVLRPRSNVDPVRVALAALERIKTVLVRSGYESRLGEPLSMKELAAQAQLLGMELPPSYVAAMRIASRIGDPETFLVTTEMETEAEKLVAEAGEEARRYAPFCRGVDKVICFDKGGGKRLVSSIRYQGELPIVERRDNGFSPIAAHFGEWLDSVADAREESVASAARMPPRLKRLLYELGFRFEYPVVGRLETGDRPAIDALIGKDLARTVRGDVDRLFDSSGRASLTLNVDEFTLAASLRTGIYVFEAEDVFRWLRTFRDENFFSDAVHAPSHPDQVRDLRRAPKEPPLVLRGVLAVSSKPAKNLTFRAASGTGAEDFYVLGRTPSTSDRAPSVLVHVVGGEVANVHAIDEPLHDLYVAPDGALWGLTTTSAVLVNGEETRLYPLQRATRGRPWWYGIGGAADRVLVWGAGALLEFDGHGFRPFAPDAGLDEGESVVALQAHGFRLWMIVSGDHVGAVARFDSVSWQPITENQVIDAALTDLDVWRSTAYALDRDGTVWKVDGGTPPRPLPIETDHQAFATETGAPRPLLGVRAVDQGMLFASTGGVIATGSGEPLFHAAEGRDPTRLVRVGGGGLGTEPAIVALCGPHAWIWRKNGFAVIDVRSV